MVGQCAVRFGWTPRDVETLTQRETRYFEALLDELARIERDEREALRHGG